MEKCTLTVVEFAEDVRAVAQQLLKHINLNEAGSHSIFAPLMAPAMMIAS